jgi:23S rRNA (cytosine1962-C5)-methyltransferase
MPFPQLTLAPKRERSLINRHPWLFSGAMATAPEAEEGDVIQVVTPEGKPMALGFFAPQSQIVARLFEFDTPDIEELPSNYWAVKVQKAMRLRRSLMSHTPQTNCFRAVHAEGDELPGLIVDAYGEVVVVQALIKGTERVLPQIVEALQSEGFPHIYLKTKDNKHLEHLERGSGWLAGGIDGSIQVEELGSKFLVDVVDGQKTGFFLDQRDNRALVKQYARGKRVLNAFAYTGGFSVTALAGGASFVRSVDISKDAIAMCERNVALNGFEEHHASTVADCFDFLKQPLEEYDLIVLDPPAFAKTQKAKANAARGYKELNLKAFKQIAPGGLLFTYSCSQAIDTTLFQQIIFAAAADARRHIRILHHLTQAPCNPASIYHPEGEYLKGLALYVE